MISFYVEFHQKGEEINFCLTYFLYHLFTITVTFPLSRRRGPCSLHSRSQTTTPASSTQVAVHLAFFYLAPTLGLGLFCVGLVITAVGLGSKGFHSPHLTLLGPALIVKGEMYRVSPKEGD